MEEKKNNIIKAIMELPIGDQNDVLMQAMGMIQRGRNEMKDECFKKAEDLSNHQNQLSQGVGKIFGYGPDEAKVMPSTFMSSMGNSGRVL